MSRTKIGVDLTKTEVLSLVQRLYWARFARQVRAMGLDPEDGLQEVYRGILARNAGSRPWDPERGGLSTYVFVVARSVIRNLADSQRRAKRRGWTVGQDADAGSYSRVSTGMDPGPLTWIEVAAQTGLSLRHLEEEAGLIRDPSVLEMFGA